MASDAEQLTPLPPPPDRAAVLRGVDRSYPGPVGRTLALEGVSMDVAIASLVAVHGRAGAGVSTLLRIVACIDRPDAGEVWVAGTELAAASRAARREIR